MGPNVASARIFFPGLYPSQKLQVFSVYRAAGRFFHFDHILEAWKIDARRPEFPFDSILPNLAEARTFDKRMEISLDEILTEQYFVFLEVLGREIHEIVPKLFERIHDPLDVLNIRPDENINIEGGPGVAIDGKGRGPDYDKGRPIFF